MNNKAINNIEIRDDFFMHPEIKSLNCDTATVMYFELHGYLDENNELLFDGSYPKFIRTIKRWKRYGTKKRIEHALNLLAEHGLIQICHDRVIFNEQEYIRAVRCGDADYVAPKKLR